MSYDTPASEERAPACAVVQGRDNLILMHAPLLIGLAVKADWDPVADAYPFVTRYYRSVLCIEHALRALAADGVVQVEGESVIDGGNHHGPYYRPGRFRATLRRPLDCGPLWEEVDRRTDEMIARAYRHHHCPCAVCKYEAWLASGPWPWNDEGRCRDE